MKYRIFPEVSGRNLKRKKYHLPQDLPAEQTIVLMAFYRNQQVDINTWLPYADQLEKKYSDLGYVEIPVIYRMSPVGRVLLNEGMRAGIPDPEAREKTITLYLNKSDFLRQIGVDSEEQIQVMLVSKDGKILWHETGLFSAEKGNRLEEVVREINKNIDQIRVN